MGCGTSSGTVPKEGAPSSNEKPVAEKEKPVAKKEKPVAEKENPVAETEKPVAETEKPVAEKEKPVAGKPDSGSVKTAEQPGDASAQSLNSTPPAKIAANLVSHSASSACPAGEHMWSVDAATLKNAGFPDVPPRAFMRIHGLERYLACNGLVGEQVRGVLASVRTQVELKGQQKSESVPIKSDQLEEPIMNDVMALLVPVGA